MSGKYIPKVGDIVNIRVGKEEWGNTFLGTIMYLAETFLILRRGYADTLDTFIQFTEDVHIEPYVTPEQLEQHKKEQVVQGILDELNRGRLHKLHDRDIAWNIYNKVVKSDN